MGKAPPGVSIKACAATRRSSASPSAGSAVWACVVIGQRLRIALPIDNSSPSLSCHLSASAQHQCIPSRSARSAARFSFVPPHTSWRPHTSGRTSARVAPIACCRRCRRRQGPRQDLPRAGDRHVTAIADPGHWRVWPGMCLRLAGKNGILRGACCPAPSGSGGPGMTEQTTPDDITAAVLASFGRSPDERLGTVMRSLTAHLHAFIKDVALTEEEWRAAIGVLTATGHITSGKRQEWILWSDALGVSMLVDALANRIPVGGGPGDGGGPAGAATESTVQGPFYVPGAPRRGYGERIDEMPAGEPLWVHGTVRSRDGRPLPGAELDVWQNGDNELYAVQDPEAPEEHLRGRFTAREDGSYGFITVRPAPYPIPHDGPVGHMLAATGRHPWRPAHIHVIVRAPGHRPVTTHVFDRDSEHIDSDAVFAVKPSLLRELSARSADDPERPPGITGAWWSLASDFVLVPAGPADEPPAAMPASHPRS